MNRRVKLPQIQKTFVYTLFNVQHVYYFVNALHASWKGGLNELALPPTNK